MLHTPQSSNPLSEDEALMPSPQLPNSIDEPCAASDSYNHNGNDSDISDLSFTDNKGTMDAFECRLQFTKYLSRLNASNVAAKQCAAYALKNRTWDEDLHSCILEQISQQSMNTRVNLLYFIVVLCEQSLKAGYPNYIDMIRKDLLQIVDNVAPCEDGGVVNVEAVRQVLPNLRDLGVIDTETMESMDEMLVARRREEADEMMEGVEDTADGGRKFDDKMIDQRMNEDRQRHKRRRENIWAVVWKTEDGEYPEFDRLWEETSDLNEDDYEIMREENELLRASIQD